MKAFLLAAGLIAGCALPAFADAPAAADNPGVTPPARSAEACRAMLSEAKQIGDAPLKRLDELPRGVLEHAVLRLVAGCPVREVVLNGQIYYVPSPLPSGVDFEPARPNGQTPWPTR